MLMNSDISKSHFSVEAFRSYLFYALLRLSYSSGYVMVPEKLSQNYKLTRDFMILFIYIHVNAFTARAN